MLYTNIYIYIYLFIFYSEDKINKIRYSSIITLLICFNWTYEYVPFIIYKLNTEEFTNTHKLQMLIF